MSTTAPAAIPTFTGYVRLATHDCTRCGVAVRVVYRSTVPVPPPLPSSYNGVWLCVPFAGGLLLSAQSHMGRDYYYGGYSYGSSAPARCGFELIDNRLVGDEVETLPQAIYRRLTRDVAYKDPEVAIVRCDPSAFRAQAFLAEATAREAGIPPITLVAGTDYLRVALATGTVPPPGVALPEVAATTRVKLPAAYLRLIKADTAPVRR